MKYETRKRLQRVRRSPRELVIRVIHEQTPKECEHAFEDDPHCTARVLRCVKCGEAKPWAYRYDCYPYIVDWGNTWAGGTVQ